MIIGLHGLPRAGKDSMADVLCNEYDFVRMAFSGRMKEACAILLNRPLIDMYEGDREAIMPEWGFSVRDFLQRFGTEAIRNNFGEDFWVKRLSSDMTTLIKQGHSQIVITDVRFPNEAEFIHNCMGMLVNVQRKGITHNNHISNQLLPCDVALCNDGTLLADWHQFVRDFMKRERL